jgi:hypothetical protein
VKYGRVVEINDVVVGLKESGSGECVVVVVRVEETTFEET